MGVGILAKRVVLELGSSTNFVYSLPGGYCKYVTVSSRDMSEASERSRTAAHASGGHCSIH